MHITGSTVLLTGAAGGLGQSIARALASRGATLVLSGRRVEALEKLAAEVGGARVVAADLADRAEVARLAEEAGPVDVLVANAALPSSGDLLDYTPEQVDRSLDVNLRAPIMLCRLLAPRMVAQGRGHLVLVGSLSGRAASPQNSLYTAAKFGLRGFAHSLRQDLHRRGVGVSVVQPGFVRDAGMFAESGADVPGGVRTVSPGQVAAATLRAIEQDRSEVNVAPVELRVASAVGGLFPSFSAAVQRRAGIEESVRQLGEGQRHKR